MIYVFAVSLFHWNFLVTAPIELTVSSLAVTVPVTSNH